MRVVSLVPAGTEIVAALGAAGSLVGVSHECDWPPAVRGLPRVTTTPVDAELSGAAIDAAVRQLRATGRAVIAADAEALGRLAPDVVIAQEVCEVCAVAGGEVRRLRDALDPTPRVVSLAAGDLAGVWDDVRAVGAVLGLGGEAEALVLTLDGRLRALRARRPLPGPPRVVCVEWLDPLYLAGHWVPELIAAAGGRDVGARPGAHSARAEWRALPELAPDLVIVALCGFGPTRARRELGALEDPEALAALAAAPVWLLDGNAYTSRPGPRLVEGAERIRAALEGREAPGLVRWAGPPVGA